MSLPHAFDVSQAGWHLWLLLAEVPGVLAALHALLHKRDPRSALGWVVFCLVFPLLGALTYLVFGRNRSRRVARRLKGHAGSVRRLPEPPVAVPAIPSHLEALERLSQAVTGRALAAGHRVHLLVDGEAAYAAMLEAIRAARSQLLLSTYIFDSRGIGEAFVTALAQAQARGVEVRVLVDGVGEWYSWPHAVPVLRRAGVVAARFQSPRPWVLAAYLNLRNHRKILVADGHTAFVGGMNIRNHHIPDARGVVVAEDLHVCLQGPVAQDLARLFIDDWRFVSRQPVGEPPPLPAGVPGTATGYCRMIEDGPDENLDRLTRVILAAIHLSRQRVQLMTPYFLPPPEIMMALQNAALRGVEVTVLLPRHNNLPFVDWASRHILPPLLRSGVTVLAYEGAFLHAKMLLVDDCYLQLGSHNLDPRSLRLNFELGVEIHDATACREAGDFFAAKCRHASPVTLQALAARPFLQRLRDAFFWLFSPYL